MQKQFVKILPFLAVSSITFGSFITTQLPDVEQSMIKQGLVNVQTIDSSILVELKYGTTDNFMGKAVYNKLTRAYLQPLAAQKLAQANAFLKQQNPRLRLLVYDAARPRSVQWNLWNALPQYTEAVRRTYVADPRIGSIHNYGCAVDVTITALSENTQKGTPLNMGTKFDYFGELAYPTQETRLLREGKLTKEQVDNRKLLRTVMRRAGFSSIDYEWWHFNALSRQQAKLTYKLVE